MCPECYVAKRTTSMDVFSPYGSSICTERQRLHMGTASKAKLVTLSRPPLTVGRARSITGNLRNVNRPFCFALTKAKQRGGEESSLLITKPIKFWSASEARQRRRRRYHPPVACFHWIHFLEPVVKYHRAPSMMIYTSQGRSSTYGSRINKYHRTFSRHFAPLWLFVLRRGW